MNFEVDYWTAR